MEKLVGSLTAQGFTPHDAVLAVDFISEVTMTQFAMMAAMDKTVSSADSRSARQAYQESWNASESLVEGIDHRNTGDDEHGDALAAARLLGAFRGLRGDSLCALDALLGEDLALTTQEQPDLPGAASDRRRDHRGDAASVVGCLGLLDTSRCLFEVGGSLVEGVLDAGARVIDRTLSVHFSLRGDDWPTWPGLAVR